MESHLQVSLLHYLNTLRRANSRTLITNYVSNRHQYRLALVVMLVGDSYPMGELQEVTVGGGAVAGVAVVTMATKAEPMAVDPRLGGLGRSQSNRASAAVVRSHAGHLP